MFEGASQANVPDIKLLTKTKTFMFEAETHWFFFRHLDTRLEAYLILVADTTSGVSVKTMTNIRYDLKLGLADARRLQRVHRLTGKSEDENAWKEKRRAMSEAMRRAKRAFSYNQMDDLQNQTIVEMRRKWEGGSKIIQTRSPTVRNGKFPGGHSSWQNGSLLGVKLTSAQGMQVCYNSGRMWWERVGRRRR